MNGTVIERLIKSIDWLKRSRIVLSQAEFSEKIGIKPSQVSEMLNGLASHRRGGDVEIRATEIG